MTPEERLTRLEVITDAQQKQLDTMDAKLDRLLEAAAMGRGAWWMIIKIGGVLTMVAAGGAWLWDKVKP